MNEIDEDVYVIFLIHGQFEVIRKPDSLRLVYKTYIFIKTIFYLRKTETEIKNSNTAATLLL